MKDPLKFRSSSGVLYTKTLFFETSGADKSSVLYSLKNEDHTYKGITYPSLRRLYLEMGDETEYLFGEEYFLNYPHLQKLLKLPWFLSEIEGWRQELRLRNTALGLKGIVEKAQKGDLKAQQFLVSRSWEKSSPGAGRPSKKSVQQEAMKIVRERSDFDEDFDRILGMQKGGTA